jgi:hypothetical protein
MARNWSDWQTIRELKKMGASGFWIDSACSDGRLSGRHDNMATFD